MRNWPIKRAHSRMINREDPEIRRKREYFEITYMCSSCGGEYICSNFEQEQLFRKLMVEISDERRYSYGLACINDDLELRLEKEAQRRENQAKEMHKLQQELNVAKHALVQLSDKLTQKERAFDIIKERLNIAEQGITPHGKKRNGDYALETFLAKNHGDACEENIRRTFDPEGSEQHKVSDPIATESQGVLENNCRARKQHLSAVDAAMQFFGW